MNYFWVEFVVRQIELYPLEPSVSGHFKSVWDARIRRAFNHPEVHRRFKRLARCTRSFGKEGLEGGCGDRSSAGVEEVAAVHVRRKSQIEKLAEW